MTVEVRLYTYAGLISAPIAAGGSKRPDNDSLLLLTQPYMGGEVFSSTAPTAVTSAAATAPAKTTLAQVQIEDNKAVHYEVTPAGQTLRTATTSSPLLKNDAIISFRAGDRLSVLEKT